MYHSLLERINNLNNVLCPEETVEDLFFDVLEALVNGDISLEQSYELGDMIAEIPTVGFEKRQQ